MSNIGLGMAPESKAPHGPRHRMSSWVAILLSLGVLVLIGLGAKLAIDNIPALGGGPTDFTGEGSEPPVVITVNPGDSLAAIGRTLKAEGVVGSVDAWLEAAKKESGTATIGPGQYEMLSQMSAQAAVARMIDPKARANDTLLLREGLTKDQTFAAIKKATGISVGRLEKASEGGKIGLPQYARNNAEGFLFPATYELEPKESATGILSRLVGRWEKAATKLKLEEGARKLGVTPYEIMIIASLVQAEGHPGDFDKVARVIYNRLDEDTWGGTYGLLQIDATLNYALGKSDINLTTEELQNTESPFNTYKYPGLPPTPINSPGEDAMQAALNPADGDWLYYVTVNPDTGETKFTNDYDEFLQFKQEFSDWLAQNPQ